MARNNKNGSTTDTNTRNPNFKSASYHTKCTVELYNAIMEFVITGNGQNPFPKTYDLNTDCPTLLGTGDKFGFDCAWQTNSNNLHIKNIIITL